MLGPILTPDIAPILFTSPSLVHIHRAISEVLCRYLDQHDPFDHERRYGSVSALLDAVEKIGLPLLQDAQGDTQTLESVRIRVRQYMKRLSSAPQANKNDMASLLTAVRQAGKTPSSLNLHFYIWDQWELRALLAGVPADLAEMGRGALRRQHFCDRALEDIDIDLLLYLAISKPEDAEAMFMSILVHSSLEDFVNIDLRDLFHKPYN